MLVKQFCNTIAKYVQNVIHEEHGIACQHDICEDVAKMFIYTKVGAFDCGKLICGNPPLDNFNPVDEEDISCKTITISDIDDSTFCIPITIA
jgi:hypothetical protein